LIIVVGRGHSGTRAIAETLAQSRVCMGTVNESYDLIPPAPMYEAAWEYSKYVQWKGGLNWEWLDTEPTPKWNRWIDIYLKPIMSHDGARGWKIPETLLSLPWVVKRFPDAHYIHWTRDPRDVILSGHGTDDLADYGIEYERTDDVLKRRAISYRYQQDLVQNTPKPRLWMPVTLQEFVLHQDDTLGKLEKFLGMKLEKIAVKPEVIGRWQLHNDIRWEDYNEILGI